MLEEELIEGCKKKQKEAQAELYRRYASRLFGICLRYCRNHADAEDLLQDVFLHVFDKVHSYRGEGSFAGWLSVICVRMSLNRIKKRLSEPYDTTDVLNDEWISIEEHPFSVEELLASLQKLNDTQRMVFNLHEIEGYSYDEIAEMTTLSALQARVYVHRAKKKLQAYWADKL